MGCCSPGGAQLCPPQPWGSMGTNFGARSCGLSLPPGDVSGVGEGRHRGGPLLPPSSGPQWGPEPPQPPAPCLFETGAKTTKPHGDSPTLGFGVSAGAAQGLPTSGDRGDLARTSSSPQSQRKEKGPSMGSQADPTRHRPGTATPQRAPGSNNRGSPGAPHSQTSPLSSGVPPGPSPPAAAPLWAPRPAARSHHLHRGYTFPSSEAREQRPVLG